MRFSVPLYDKMIKNLYGGICRTTLQLICLPRHVSLPQESAGFSVTMAVLALVTPLRDIDTEKMACFCGTMVRTVKNQKYFLSFLFRAMKMNSMAVNPHMDEPP